MKLNPLKHLRGHVMAATLMLGLAQPGLSQTDSYTNAFDAANSTASYLYWYGLGYGNTSMTWDATHDAKSNVNSGALQVSLPFGASGDQAVMFGTFNNQYGYDGTTIYDGTKFDTISFDVLVNTPMPLNGAGNYGEIQVGFVRQGWQNGGTFYPNSPTIPASAANGWVHIVQNVDQTSVGLNQVAGFNFKYTSFSGYPTTPMTFWIDNIVAHLTPVVAPPPTLSAPTKPISGLNLFSSPGNGDAFQRTGIKLNNNTGLTWVGSPTPVTYAVTITNFPDGAAYAGYQGHIFITTGNPLPSYETAPDYNETNVIWLNIKANGNGTGYAQFIYKINEPNSNTNMFGPEYIGTASAGTLVTLDAPATVGTWSLTFNQNTNVTITGPGGVSTNFSIRAAIPAEFADPLNIVFGGQPNGAGNFGQSVVLAGASITGNAAPVSENFMDDTALDTVTWGILSGDQAMVQLFPLDAGAKLVKWTLPDVGFDLQVTTNVANSNSWVTLTGSGAAGPALISFASSGSRTVLVPSALLGSSANYFRLIKRVFSQLQILLPGETNAPNTLAGKVGTPNPVSLGAGGFVNVTINAVDATYHIVNGVSDTINLTSTDGSAIMPLDAGLVNGALTQIVQFGTSGAWTITATNVTATMPAVTSAAVTVTP